MENEHIQVSRGYQNIAYTLDDKSLFNYSGYRFLKNRDRDGLAKCLKVSQNGQVKLIYFIEDRKPVTSIYRCISFAEFCELLEQVFRIIMDVRENGFLSPANLDLTFEHIFAEVDGGDVRLVYLPVNGPEADSTDLQMAFRIRCGELISGNPEYREPMTDMVCRALIDESKDLDGVIRALQQVSTGSRMAQRDGQERRRSAGQGTATANLRLVSQHPSVPLTLLIQKTGFIVGKKGAGVDAGIQHATVSRRHCVFYFEDGQYYVEDLDSKNGTYVNGGHPILSHQRVRIKNGDILTIADIPFLVQI